jgi:hypothetical protein
MTTSDEILVAARILMKQISAHTGQPCSITLQAGDPVEGEFWTVFSDNADFFLTAPDSDALYAQIKAYSQRYTVALSTPSSGVKL